MSNQLLSLGAWYFLPNLVTGWLQSLYYRVTIRAGDPIPQPGHPRFERHKQNIFVLVIISYLLYTIYEVDWDLQRQGDFYRDLGVAIDSDDRRIQSRFRRLTVQFHPDKLNNPSPEQLAYAQAFYVHLKNARDTLVDPAKRFAYERFGPDMLEWKTCITKLDFIQAGLKQMVPYYIISLVTVIGMGFFGYSEYGRYWQYFSIAAMFVFEAHTITRPHFPFIFARIINPLLERLGNHPPYLPYQAIEVARRISISVFIAVSQIAPRLAVSQTEVDSPQNRQQQLNRLYGLTRAMDGNVERLVRLETVPFLDDEETEKRLKLQLKTWLVQNEIRNEPGVDAAIKNALERKMADMSTE